MYIKRECRINDKLEVEKNYPWNAGAPGKDRRGKRNPTPEEMAKQNLWRRKRDLRRILELNFKGGDYHVTLTCSPDQRPDMKDAMRVIREFRDRLRAAYKRQGWELKYVITAETGERGAVHWHMICNDQQNDKTSTVRLIRSIWTRGRPYFVPLDDNREYGQLAEYIIKETSKRIAEGKTMEKLSYMCSRNMIKPVVRKKKVLANGWSLKPKPREGWVLDESSVINGRNPYTGMPYQHYTLYRIQERGEPWKSRKSSLSLIPGY